jgi:hypothetical protein
VPPYTWSISAGQLLPGLSLVKGPPVAISGTPTTAGTFTFTVTMTDKTGTHTGEPGSITISWIGSPVERSHMAARRETHESRQTRRMDDHKPHDLN